MRREADKSAARTIGKVALLILLVLAQVPRVYPDSSLLLRYDDGGAEYFWSDYYPNGIAVEFTSPALKWRITAILIYGFAVIRDEKSFIVEVRDESFNLAFRTSVPISNHFKNATLDWSRIPLPSVVVKGNFYVCVYPMLEFNGTQLWIAMDNDTAPDRCLLIDCYRQEVRGWKKGHAMIRVEGEEVIDFIEIIPDAISMNEDVLELYFKVIAPSNDTEVRSVIQIGSLTEGCEVIYEKGLYRTRVEWSKPMNVKEPVKIMLSAKALNLTTTLVLKLNGTVFSKYLRLKEENERLKATIDGFKVEMEVLRNRLEKEENATALLNTSLKEYQRMLSEKAEENEKLIEELKTLRILIVLLAILVAFLAFHTLRIRSTIRGRDEKCLRRH